MNIDVSPCLILGNNEYHHLKKMLFSILDQVENINTLFVGVGRTPIPLMSLIECYCGKEKVIHLPLSGFRHNYPGENHELLRSPLNKQHMLSLDEHFKNFVPIHRLKDIDQILLIDFVDSGASLAAVARYLSQYIKNAKLDCRVHPIALYKSKISTDFRQTLDAINLSFTAVEIPSFSNHITDGEFKFGRGKYYDVISPYNRSFSIEAGDQTHQLVSDFTQYHHYQVQLIQRMLVDEEIENPLVGEMSLEFVSNGTVIKHCSSSVESNRLCRLFNSFPYHVKANQLEKEVQYSFVSGMTLEKQVFSEQKGAFKSIAQLAHYLGEIHWHSPILFPDYANICHQRGATVIKNNHCYGYFSQIHGDLHFRNMIVDDNNKLIFIDRMRACGDIYYDFPFVVSLLGQARQTKKAFYVDLVEVFFCNYELYVDKKDNFYQAFLVNFIHYCHIASRTHKNIIPAFQEWSDADKIAEIASKYSCFKEFLRQEYNLFSPQKIAKLSSVNKDDFHV
ncbi:hypothetical protein F0225_09925 [Vibrio pectenicida]|uniref:Uncharacterized protein n=1 Tax=Vibrio pectenicida TaxID=62763 RepID=A0A7Y3ZYZ0_9VIBR|nr:hypothetical protein [Vibrio pectenicida]NOH71651.1 hypothetical protein [Vibrio pectenicida]